MFSKRFLSGAALTALSFAMANAAGGGEAHAQSTASQIQEDDVIIVTGQRQSLDGVMVVEHGAKARATITQDYISRAAPGQTVLETINLIPGVNFTNSDPYGSSGGAINMRGFDGARISLTVDGIPLNDTGNYAIYSNQQLDPELIERANVNLGTTDVDSPTASAVGGTINYITRIPDEEAGVIGSVSGGSWNFHRGFALAETGAFGPLGTRAFVAGSFTEYDQFIGPGGLQKSQYNGGIYQPIGENGDFARVSFHYNENRNNFYNRFNQATFNAGGRPVSTASCTTLDGVNGTAQNSSTDGCGAFIGLSINPSNTGNIRGQSRFSLSDSLTLTVDPSFQYVRANGGGSSVISETAPQLIGQTDVAGIDLNHDGDFLDSVRLFSPSNTNTYRYGLTSSLLWDITSTQSVRFGYTYDWGRHRQTGEFGFLNSNGNPESVFGGRDGFGTPIVNGLGAVFQKRDRLSIASLSQFSAEYRGDFLDDALTLIVGLRAPQFERELDQNCFSQKGNSSSTQYCTTMAPFATDANGFVQFDLNEDGDLGDTVQGVPESRLYAPPFTGTVEYEDVLPNVGVIYRPAEGHQIFFSYAEGLSDPRTDDLYSGITVAQLDEAQPETTKAYDIGYRYQGESIMFSSALWFNSFENRIERSQDPLDPTLFYSRNVGAVDLWGAEGALGWNATEQLFLYGAVSYTTSELANGGTEVVDTPDWTVSARAEYDIGQFTIGAQANYVGDRFANDANTEVAPGYTTVDLDARYDLSSLIGSEGTYVQLNVINLFDEEYLGQMSSGTGTGTALYNLGAPQTVMVALRAEF